MFVRPESLAHGCRALRSTLSIALLAAALGSVLGGRPARAGAFVGGSTQTFATVANPRTAAFGDVNNDGRVDMVVPSSSGAGISVFFGQAGGGFGSAVNQSWTAIRYLQLADIDGDGKLDIVAVQFVGGSTQVVIIRGNGDGTFAGAWYFAAPTNSEFVTVADFNNDGKPDVATAGNETSTSGILRVYLNTTASYVNFTSNDYATGAQPRGIATGLLTSSGRPDIVTANFSAGSITIYKNDLTGHFGNRQDVTGVKSCYGITVGTLFYSDRPQIFTSNRDSSSVTMFYNFDGLAWNHITCTTPADPRDLSIDDADGDANPDLLVCCGSSNKVSILSPDGYSGARLEPHHDVNVGANPGFAAVVNWDGGLKSDLLTVSRGAASLMLTQGMPKTGWALGDTIPDFSAPNQMGNTFQFSGLRGTWVLLDLCSGWCTPCRVVMAKDTEAIIAAWNGHPTVHFDYVTGLGDGDTYGVASTQADAQAWANTYGINRNVLHSGGSLSNGVRSVFASSQLFATPTLRLVAPDGRIVWLYQGAAWDTTIMRVVANAAGVAVPASTGSPSCASATLNVTYGPYAISEPADQLGAHPTFFFDGLSGFGENFSAQLSMSRNFVAGAEDWQLEFAYWPFAGGPNLPPDQMGTDFPWQFTLTSVVLDPMTRSLPPGAVASISYEGTDVSNWGDVTTVPVTWSNGTLTLGAIPAATLAALPPIRRLYFSIPMSIQAIVDAGPRPIPASLELRAPWPNPAQNVSRLAWSQPQGGPARLDLYDVSGRLVRTVHDGFAAAGEHTAEWDLRDRGGSRVDSGVYFARLSVSGAVKTKRVVVSR